MLPVTTVEMENRPCPSGLVGSQIYVRNVISNPFSTVYGAWSLQQYNCVVQDIIVINPPSPPAPVYPPDAPASFTLSSSACSPDPGTIVAAEAFIIAHYRAWPAGRCPDTGGLGFWYSSWLNNGMSYSWLSEALDNAYYSSGGAVQEAIGMDTYCQQNAQSNNYQSQYTYKYITGSGNVCQRQG